MMRYVYWGVTILLAIVVACFAVSNRNVVDLQFWPLPLALAVPLYLVVLVVLLFGLAVGWFAGWAGSWKVRRERRRHAKRVEQLERDLDRLSADAVPADGKSLARAG